MSMPWRQAASIRPSLKPHIAKTSSQKSLRLLKDLLDEERLACLRELLLNCADCDVNRGHFCLTSTKNGRNQSFGPIGHEPLTALSKAAHSTVRWQCDAQDALQHNVAGMIRACGRLRAASMPARSAICRADRSAVSILKRDASGAHRPLWQNRHDGGPDLADGNGRRRRFSRLRPALQRNTSRTCPPRRQTVRRPPGALA